MAKLIPKHTRGSNQPHDSPIRYYYKGMTILEFASSKSLVRFCKHKNIKLISFAHHICNNKVRFVSVKAECPHHMGVAGSRDSPGSGGGGVLDDDNDDTQRTPQELTAALGLKIK